MCPRVCSLPILANASRLRPERQWRTICRPANSGERCINNRNRLAAMRAQRDTRSPPLAKKGGISQSEPCERGAQGALSVEQATHRRTYGATRPRKCKNAQPSLLTCEPIKQIGTSFAAIQPKRDGRFAKRDGKTKQGRTGRVD